MDWKISGANGYVMRVFFLDVKTLRLWIAIITVTVNGTVRKYALSSSLLSFSEKYK